MRKTLHSVKWKAWISGRSICRLFTCVTFLLLGINQSNAQLEIIDSLKSRLSGKIQSEKVDHLNAIGKAFWSLQILDSAISYSRKAARYAEEIEYSFGLGEAYYNIAAIGFENSNFLDSESDIKRAIAIFHEINDHKREARSYVILGRAIWAQSKFDAAKKVFEQANSIFQQLGDSINLGETYALMALAEEERGNYEQSFRYGIKAMTYSSEEAYNALGQLYADVGDYNTALYYYSRVKNPNLKIYMNLKIGEAYFLQNKYDSAIYHYQNYIKEKGAQSKQLLSKPYALMGAVYLALKDYEKAIFYLKYSLDNFRKANNRNWVMRVLLDLGRTYKEIGDYKEAMEYTAELLAHAKESGARQYARDAHFLLAEFYDGLQQKDSAYSHLKKYATLNSAIDIDVSARNLEFYKSANEREQAQLKINLLTQQRLLQQEELNQTSQQRKLLIIGILAIIVVGIVIVRNILLKKRNVEHLKELTDQELRMQKLETIKQVGEMEMEVLRTQMNPHFIFNSLNSINRFILKNSTTEASDYLTKFSRLVRMILQNSQSKRIPLDQELKSLELYLNLEALRFDDHFSYKIRYEDELDITALQVPPLIIQPYAENAIWHGIMNKKERGQLDIELWTEKGFLYIKITDDGVGRAKAAELAGKPNENYVSMGLDITAKRIAMSQGGDTSENQVVVINDLVDSQGHPCGTEVILKLQEIYD